MKQKSWISIVFSFASQCRGKIALSVLCAIISVIAGLIPYWSVYQIITLFIGGSPVDVYKRQRHRHFPGVPYQLSDP